MPRLHLGLKYRIVTRYASPLGTTLLNELCDKYGSDKGSNKEFGHVYPWDPHTYTHYYSHILEAQRFEITNVFECGIGTTDLSFPANMGLEGKPGASLRVWRDYFPNAKIVGADIDSNVLFQESRISTYYLDQTNPTEIDKFWKLVGVSDFDLIIDDGLHTFEAGKTLFESSISKLGPKGIYVIEDVTTTALSEYFDYFQKEYKFNVEYITLSQRGKLLENNSLVVIRRNLSAEYCLT